MTDNYNDWLEKRQLTKEEILDKLPLNKCLNCPHAVEMSYTHHIGCNRLYKTEISRIALTLKQEKISIVAVIAGIEINLIEVNPHGYKEGWAFWPWKFDPTWVKCRLPIE